MKVEIRMPRNVQFIYEHALAREELVTGFGAKNVAWETSDPWKFTAALNGTRRELANRSAYAGFINGVETVYSKLIRPQYQGGKYNRTRSVNQYLTHWIYPYKGKFHPQMVRALLNIAGARRGDKLFEPFLGSGTAALEGQLLGLDVIGIDISPLCVLLSRVKTQSWKSAPIISKKVNELIESDVSFESFSVSTRKPEVSDFFEVARMVTLSDVANRGRDPDKAFRKNLLAMSSSIEAMAKAIKQEHLELGDVQVALADVRSCKDAISQEWADVVVTSPPYSIALDYVKNDEHALEAMGLDTKAIREDFIGVAGRGLEGRLRRYTEDMKMALRTVYEVLKPGKLAVFVLGDVTIGKEEKLTTNDFIGWAKTVGFRYERELPKIVFGLYNVMSDEKIIFLKKE